MIEHLFTPEALIALLTLTFLEIVLGIDNIIFISIVSNKLPEAERPKARNIGLSLALIFRVLLLMGISWLTHFTTPLFTFLDFEISGRDLILALGGLFLIFKSTSEMHHKIEGEEELVNSGTSKSLASIIGQILILDVIFSFDSILTAVGLTDQLYLMIAAVIISMVVMMLFSGKISDFIHKHPTLEVLALSFLILIGFMLVVEALHYHVPKGYIYFAVFFSLLVEMINIRARNSRKNRSEALRLKKRLIDENN